MRPERAPGSAGASQRHDGAVKRRATPFLRTLLCASLLAALCACASSGRGGAGVEMSSKGEIIVGGGVGTRLGTP